MNRDRYIDFEYMTGQGDDNLLLDIAHGILFDINDVNKMPWTAESRTDGTAITIGLVVDKKVRK